MKSTLIILDWRDSIFNDKIESKSSPAMLLLQINDYKLEQWVTKLNQGNVIKDSNMEHTVVCSDTRL